MSSSIQALRERLAALHNRMKNRLLEKGDQKWSPEDQAAHDADEADFTRTQQQMENLQRVLDREAEDNFRDVQKRHDDKDPKAAARRGLDIWLRKTPGMINAGLMPDLTAEERQVIMNTMSTTTNTEGGYTVEPRVASSFIDFLKDYGGMRRVASQITTSNGADMSWPTTDGTAEVGEQVAQNVAAAAADLLTLDEAIPDLPAAPPPRGRRFIRRRRVFPAPRPPWSGQPSVVRAKART